MGNTHKQRPRKVKIPLAWRAAVWIGLVLLGSSLFVIISYKLGGRLPLQGGDSADPFFGEAIFGIAIPVFLKVFIDKILTGVLQKKSATDITKEVRVDLERTAAAVVVEEAINAAASGGSSSTAGSSGGVKGGGGSSGGGGASGGY